jgi:acyl carrier protein
LELSSARFRNAAGNFLHPGVLDEALLARITALNAGEAQNAQLWPKSVDQAAFFAKCPERGWAWARPHGGNSADGTRRVDLDLCDEHGEIFACLRGLTAVSLARVDNMELVASDDMTAEVQKSIGLWLCEVLKFSADSIALDRQLAEHGLDSVSSIQLTNRINKAYRLKLRPTIIHEHPTLADLARHVVETRAEAVEDVSEVKRAAGAGSDQHVSPVHTNHSNMSRFLLMPGAIVPHSPPGQHGGSR